MARRASSITSGTARAASGDDSRAPRVWLPERPEEGQVHPTTISLPEGRRLVAYYQLHFIDPQWGPISFRLWVYRQLGNDLPEYEVVAE